MWQTVIVQNIPVEIPGALAERLIRAGVAHLPETSDLPNPIDSESSGIPTLPGPRPATANKRRKSSKGSKGKNTK